MTEGVDKKSKALKRCSNPPYEILQNKKGSTALVLARFGGRLFALQKELRTAYMSKLLTP